MARRRGRRAGSEAINPQHQTIRMVLRVVGPILILVGVFVFLSASGIEEAAPGFFENSDAHMRASEKAMGRRATGGILGGLGLMLTVFGFQGALARYHAAEHAPVIRDAVGYMADGTKESVKTVARAVAEGIRDPEAEPEEPDIRCHKCNQANDADASFCKSCGAALVKSVACPACNELNDPDANFCDNCGGSLPA